MNWEKLAALVLMFGSAWLLGKVKTHENEPLVSAVPTVQVISWYSPPSCVVRPAVGDSLLWYDPDGRAVAQVGIPEDTSFVLRLYANFRFQLTPAGRCSR